MQSPRFLQSNALQEPGAFVKLSARIFFRRNKGTFYSFCAECSLQYFRRKAGFSIFPV